MKRIFWKLFLSFWVAMTLIGIAFAMVYVSHVPEVKQARRSYMLQHAFQLHGRRMRQFLTRGKPAISLKINVSLTHRFRAHAYFFRDGKVLATPWPISPTIRRLAQEARQKGRSIEQLGNPLDYFSVPLPRLPGKKHVDVIVGTIPHPSRLEKYLQPQTLLLRLVIIFVVAGLICYFLATLFTNPIQRLRQTAQRLADGELGVRVDHQVRDLNDEIGDLGRDFDQMATRIQGLIDAQTRLLRDISHELRSPLARLSVALGIARHKAGEGASGSLDRIEREADRLNELIGHLLTLTALESATKVRKSQQFRLHELLERIVADADFEARALGCQVQLIQSQEIELAGEQELLHQAFENVVRNAIRFTSSDSIVEVQMESKDLNGQPTAFVTVKDKGPGVPEEMLAKLFQPFFQVEDARVPHRGGTGLGLAITLRAVQRHGGDVSIANLPDGGLQVTVQLPIHLPSPAAS